MELKKFKERYADHKDINSDINILIRHIMGDVNITPFLELADSDVKRLGKWISRHLKGEPIEKIIGYSVFCDCYIQYSKHTLTPRLETEMVVEYAKEFIGDKALSVLDMCCGSGAIGIALAKHTNARVVCADISSKAIKMCKLNAKLNNIKIEAVRTDLFHNITEKYDVIVCNPPYISHAEYDTLDRMVIKYDPKLALVAEDNGLGVYRRIADCVSDYLHDDGVIILEIGYNQGDAVRDIMADRFENVEVNIDYNGNDRVVIAKNIIRR
ncbi:MAG: peptide chain release factor N(5)-glutamine methyltransferase [Clostridiales bacterium]|nr:peptide chain release factor N(5)-glutamine methyltransferase [Clostridiales bacterium]